MVRSVGVRETNSVRDTQVETATVITGDNILRYRLMVIRSGLKLESYGMSASKVNAGKIAKEILVKAGIKPARNKKELLIQFTDYLNNGGLDNVG